MSGQVYGLNVQWNQGCAPTDQGDPNSFHSFQIENLKKAHPAFTHSQLRPNRIVYTGDYPCVHSQYLGFDPELSHRDFEEVRLDLLQESGLQLPHWLATLVPGESAEISNEGVLQPHGSTGNITCRQQVTVSDSIIVFPEQNA
jgi:hypothetical protein